MDAPDRQLLERFRQRHEEVAFQALLHRHGPMVLGVCRRLLRDEQAAEDAFQATFLVLARNAGSIRRPEALAGWLYGVASRVTARLKGSSARKEAAMTQLHHAVHRPPNRRRFRRSEGLPPSRDVQAGEQDIVVGRPETFLLNFPRPG